MKVAFATYDRPNDVGGVSSWLQRLLPFLKRAGISVEAHVFSGQPGANCEAFAREGIPFRLFFGDSDIRQSVRNCLKLVEENPPDIYVPNCVIPAYYAAGYMRQQGVNTVGVLHSDDPFYWGIVDQFVNGRSAFRLSAVVAVSKFIEDALAAAVSRPLVVRRIGCGVPIPLERAKAANPVFRLVYTGRLEEEQKRISKVTRALCSVAKQNPNVEAWIVGEGSARPNVLRIIAAEGLPPERVKLLGRVAVADIYSVLSRCHAFVLLSDYEGLPVSMLEAMATGVVPICLEMRSGIAEAIQSDFNGLIVKNREDDFFAGVAALQSDAGLWTRLSNHAQETVQRRFSHEICAAAWLDLLRSLKTNPASEGINVPQTIRLPKRNPKFGVYDCRPGLLRGTLNAITMSLGRYRQRVLSKVLR